jgi:two-component system, OmpR family, phosphate regulon sensor histidine kinase PhoR
MFKKRLLWHLYPSYLVITVLFLAALTWVSSGRLKAFYMDNMLVDQKARTLLVRELVDERLSGGDYAGLESYCKMLGAKTGERITVILPDGRVVADSNKDPAKMENHADRPEVISALAGGDGFARRISPTLGKEMVYYALPAVKDGEIVGVVRTSIFRGDIDRALDRLYRQVALGGAAIALFVAFLGLMASKRVGRVINELERGASRFASGELTGRLPVPEYEEMARLTESMNQMAAQLNERINTITRQRNEQEAILSGMAEGVVAVDNSGRVLDVNQAAARLLKLDQAAVKGRNVQEVVRNTELGVFITGALEGGAPSECELSLIGKEELIVQAHGAPMRDERGGILGAVVVLSDVTRLKKLERVRRDFVANVSHELRTPITSIMGFSEMLSGGEEDSDEAKRYAGIIFKQAERLNEIIEDLMSLSVIERKAEKKEIELAPGMLADVVRTAAELCYFKAEEKKITIGINCGDEVIAMINPQLLEQAVVNLIDNAVKYSEPGRPVDVRCGKDERGPFITVKDSGFGIEEKHFARLFERFYRVDRSRSRAVGGTGLGLAIVKHIVQAHGGEVGVKSYPGEGSTFTIRLTEAGAAEKPSS